MNRPRRQLLCQAGAAAALAALPRVALPGIAWAQAYPTRPVRWLVPFAAGGSTHIVARLIGGRPFERVPPNVIIPHQPGARTILAPPAGDGAPPGRHHPPVLAGPGATQATL